MPLDPGVWRAWRSPLFVVGVFLLLVGVTCAVFLVYTSDHGWRGDPDPNLVGVGVLFFLATATGFIMTIVGVSRAVDLNRREKAKKNAA